MEFFINLQIGGRTANIKAQKLPNKALREYWLLTFSDGTTVEISNNRPLFISKNLKHREPMWKIESGSLMYSNTLTDIAKAIEKQLSRIK